MKLTARTLTLAVACLGVSFVFGAPAFAQADPQIGVWKLNVAKSKYTPGPAPKSTTTKIEAAAAGAHRVVVDQTAADGTSTHWEFTASYDGKDNPITGNPNADTVARTRVNATTVQTVTKKGGKVWTTQLSEVSADGKTRTVTTKGVNAKGQPVNNVGVYERQ